MRIVATLAAILVLPCGLFADDSQVPAIDLSIAPPAVCASDAHPADATASGKYDTSVYHLKHAHAHQIIAAVRQALCKSFPAELAQHPGCCSAVSVVFMPTSSDDTLVVICPREDADLVKQAISSCDVEKQYAVKLQLFEISPTGEAVAVGDPAVVVGREGIVQCKTSANGPVTLRLQIGDSNPGLTDPAKAVATETPEEPYCCGPTCGQSEMEAEAPAETSVCPTSCTTPPTCQATCPALTSACPVTSSTNRAACNGTCHAGHGECGTVCSSECAACKAKCAGTCKCESTGSCDCGSPASSSTELSDACEKSPQTTSLTQSLTPEENQILIRILLHSWMLEHQEHFGNGIARDVTPAGETVESGPGCNSSAAKESPANSSTSFEAPAEKAGVELGTPAPAASAAEVPATTQTTTPYDPAPAASLVENVETGTLRVPDAPTNDDGFHLSGVYRLGPCEQDDVAVTRVSDSDSCDSAACPSSADACSAQILGPVCPGSCSEPPALLTLSARKDAVQNLNIVVSPRWQSELAKIYQGRRLSEIFEPRNCQDPGAASLGRLLVEIPKPASDAYGENAPHHNVVVVDMPDRIRVFESAIGGPPVAAAYVPNCSEYYRAFLGEIGLGPSRLEEIMQAGHLQEDLLEGGRELPSVTHSKLDTTVVTYPLRDLVLLDNAERPVFDTCTIIDHIESAVAPETWGHPSVSIQLDQQTMSLVIRQTPEVHKKIEAHLRDLRRQQVKQLTGLIERLSTDSEQSDD